MNRSNADILSDVASDIEGSSIATEKTASLLELFYECLDEESSYLGKEDHWAAKLVSKRLSRLLVFLSVIQRDISKTREAIDTNYSTLRGLLDREGDERGDGLGEENTNESTKAAAMRDYLRSKVECSEEKKLELLYGFALGLFDSKHTA